jgi:hypothetical protein
MVFEIIEDGFIEFLNPKQYQPIEVDGRRSKSTDHLLYRDKYRTNSIFNHYDMEDSKSYSYYERCAARFLGLKNDGKNTFFVMATGYPVSENMFHSFLSSIKRQCPGADLLIIHLRAPDKSAMLPRIEQTLNLGDAAIFEFTPTSEMAPLTFVEASDDICLAHVIISYVAQRIYAGAEK